jgi:hypothetical protein
MKTNFKDASNAAGSAILTALTSLRTVESDLRDVVRDLGALKTLEPPDPRDFLHKADAVADPAQEIADLKSDAHLMVQRLNEIVSVAELRRIFIEQHLLAE